jgi:hypothetical protein
MNVRHIAVDRLALVIAIISLALSGYNSCVAQRHEYLFTQPRVFINFYHNDTGAGWHLLNDGLGIARIRGFRALFDGNKMNIYSMPDALSPFGFPPTKVTFGNPYAGLIIRAEATNVLTLLSVPPGPATDTLVRDNARLIFEICYCSIYDECWLSSSRDIESKRDNSCSTFANEQRSNWWKG